MHTIRVITRLATMLAGLIAPWLRLSFVSALSRLCLGFVSALSQLCLNFVSASISCEHCRSSRNNPHYAPRHVIYYYSRRIILAYFTCPQTGTFTLLTKSSIFFLFQMIQSRDIVLTARFLFWMCSRRWDRSNSTNQYKKQI